jgi:hypothetical protein
MKITQLFTRQRVARVMSIHGFVIPGFLVWFALICLASKTYFELLSRRDVSIILTPYLTGVAIAAALASVTFGYARVAPEREKADLISIGELFLYGSINLGMSLLVCWLTLAPYSRLWKVPYVGWVVVGVFSYGLLFLITAARSVHRALVDLQGHLMMKIREKDLWKMGRPESAVVEDHAVH